MKAILDTHTLLWWLDDSERLSRDGIQIVEHFDNEILVSTASIWEIEIKRSSGKLRTPAPLLDRLLESRLATIPMTAAHASVAGRLPAHHSDPFDRMLIAQAICEGATLLSSDRAFATYDVPVIDPTH